MRRHLNYLKYILRHKWFVCVACLRLKPPPVSLFWRAVVHDLSKFRPSEWMPYARTFYTSDGSKQYNEGPDFALAWNDHQNRNKHHWQYYLLTWDRGETVALPMPGIYVWEMVADWMGTGRAITGRWETNEWYGKNKDKMILHPETRKRVEQLICSKGWL